MIPCEYECVNMHCCIHYNGSEDVHSIEEKINYIFNQHVELKETLDFIKDTLVKADTTITKVAGEVMPTINSLMESPMIKMLGGKKK